LWQGHTLCLRRRSLLTLVIVALATELVANVGVQWAFGVIGISVTMPLIFGAMLAGSALLGWWFLGEAVGKRAVLAIGLITTAVVFLSRGAEVTAASVTLRSQPVFVLLAVAAALLAGSIYAALGTVLRHLGESNLPPTFAVFVVTGTGVLSLGLLSLWRLGPAGLLHTPHNQIVWMVAAGLTNVVGFLLITKGLQLTTVVRANLLNTTQVALAALAGVLLFDERFSLWLAGGLIMTVAGILLICLEQSAEQHV